MQNAIYSGFVIHNRTMPKSHKFQYKLSMFFLDIDNLHDIFKNIPIVSIDKFNLISFYRKNYFPSKMNLSIRQEIENEIKRHGYNEIPKKIYILTHLAYLGFCYNPVTFYYCYDEDDKLIFFLSEVNNTPWNERYLYLHKINKEDHNMWSQDKQFHVSPFLPMNMKYEWKINNPNGQIRVYLACIDKKPIFRASLKLIKSNLNLISCLKVFILSPITTLFILFRIYWQALILFSKKIPFYQHPNRI